jgi:hypothetical protein
MADQSISQLPVATALTGNELAVVVQRGITKQTQLQDIANLANLAALQNVTSSDIADPTSALNTIGKVEGRIVFNITTQLIAVATGQLPTSPWLQYTISGYSGYSGYSGLNGEVAFSGTSGYSGISGYSGYSGKSGYSGISGYSGFSGISGYSGSGVSGFSGISGYSGYSGTSGYSGFSGTSGYSGIGSVTSVSGTGTVSGITLSGTVTSTGNLTLGGALDLSSPPVIGDTTPNGISGTIITATQYYVGITGGEF